MWVSQPVWPSVRPMPGHTYTAQCVGTDLHAPLRNSETSKVPFSGSPSLEYTFDHTFDRTPFRKDAKRYDDHKPSWKLRTQALGVRWNFPTGNRCSFTLIRATDAAWSTELGLRLIKLGWKHSFSFHILQLRRMRLCEIYSLDFASVIALDFSDSAKFR